MLLFLEHTSGAIIKKVATLRVPFFYHSQTTFLCMVKANKKFEISGSIRRSYRAYIDTSYEEKHCSRSYGLRKRADEDYSTAQNLEQRKARLGRKD